MESLNSVDRTTSQMITDVCDELQRGVEKILIIYDDRLQKVRSVEFTATGGSVSDLIKEFSLDQREPGGETSLQFFSQNPFSSEVLYSSHPYLSNLLASPSEIEAIRNLSSSKKGLKQSLLFPDDLKKALDKMGGLEREKGEHVDKESSYQPKQALLSEVVRGIREVLTSTRSMLEGDQLNVSNIRGLLDLVTIAWKDICPYLISGEEEKKIAEITEEAFRARFGWGKRE